MKARLLALTLLTAAGCGERREARNLSAEEVANQLAGVAIQPGLWEATSEITGVSAPQLPFEVRRRMIGPRPAARSCITPEQAARPGAHFLAARTGGACRYEDFTMHDGRLRGTMVCPDPALPRPTIATMEGRYGARRYELRMRMETAMPDGATMILDIRARGRRIGDCPAEPQPAPKEEKG